jgi:lysophospholipase L1-like esterase
MRQSLLILFVIVCSSVYAQKSIDTSYNTSYYEQKVTLFRLLPDTKGEIIFLGNSITDIAEWAELWQNSKVKNRGISTDNTFGVLARLDEVVSSKPEKIFIMIGINDVAKGTPDSVISSNHRKIIDYIKQYTPKTKIYFQSVLPTNNDFTEYKGYQNKMDHIKVVNTNLQQICKEKGVVYIDLFSSFIDSNGKLDATYTNDGLHLNGEGYMHWKHILIQNGYMK